MLNLYRRHKERCKLYSKGQSATNCTCPIWITGTIKGRQQRQSLKTKDWYHANTKKDLIESGEMQLKESGNFKTAALTVTDAIENYLDDCRVRGTSPSSIHSYANTFKTLTDWMKTAKISNSICIFDLSVLDEYRQFRAPSLQPSTQRKEIVHLRTFFSWCLDRDLVATNWAKKIRMPKTPKNITMPFTVDEINKLTGALSILPEDERPYTTALIYTLLYSGLRISDIVSLERSRLGSDGRLLLRMEKTGNAVYVKLPAKAVDALKALPITKSPYFFWDGKIQISSAINQARECVARLGYLAPVQNVHPHRFRDTFAITLLLAGVDIRTVQLLLGHESLHTTEKHYAPYVKEFQVKLDSAVDKLNF